MPPYSELNRYLSRQAEQDVRRRITRVFVCTSGGGDVVLGFYTLSALSVEPNALPEERSRKPPRHPVPCVLLGRLAVDRSAHGRGVGRMLLANAVRRVIAAGESVAMYAMIVDAETTARNASTRGSDRDSSEWQKLAR